MRPGCGSGRGAECFWADDSGVFTGHQLPTPVAWGLGPCCCSPPGPGPGLQAAPLQRRGDGGLRTSACPLLAPVSPWKSTVHSTLGHTPTPKPLALGGPSGVPGSVRSVFGGNSVALWGHPLPQASPHPQGGRGS